MSTRTLNGIMIVDCSGRLIFGEESAKLRDTIKKLLTQSPDIVLNLRGLEQVDSGGLGALVSLYTSAKHAGGTLKLARLGPRVNDLLYITKLFTIFEVFDDEEKAAKSFGKTAQ
jgi:anti-sigma B factor antagonist